ncbi:MAG: hypothetical protein OEY38_21625 [Gammaproteobacteria bacterium]|nr:hypothetical protein [Gammaproteobacteria bacterium]
MFILKNINCICLFFGFILVATSSIANANFGGYDRGEIVGVGSILNVIEDNDISLEKERLQFIVDQRVKFSGLFEFKNTSDKPKLVTFAFPQITFWQVLYDNKSGGYAPGKYFDQEPRITINEVPVKKLARLFSYDQSNFSAPIIAYTQDEMQSRLIDWANDNETESSPTKPILLWLVFEKSLKPNETIDLSIKFTAPWYFIDEYWSYGRITNGSRFFEYITSTANTWKEGTVKDFEARFIFPEDASDKIRFFPEGWVKIQNGEAIYRKLNYKPSSDNHLRVKWFSNLAMEIGNLSLEEYKTFGEACYSNLNYKDYQWRFLSDHSAKTAWCVQPNALKCPKFLLKPISEKVSIYKRVAIQTGFAKSKRLHQQNSRPKTITLNIEKDEKVYTQKLHMEDTEQIQILQLDQPFQFVNKNETGFRDEYNEVSLRIDEIYKGVKWDDICISELEFLP